MPTTKPERAIDVERSAVVRLKEQARIRVEEAEDDDANYVSTYWAGYHRALEDVLAMENE
jgi:hypothetical protein